MYHWLAGEGFPGIACHLFDSAEPGRCRKTERGLMYVERKGSGNEKAADSFEGISGFFEVFTPLNLVAGTGFEPVTFGL
ncbi:MAG: hypothetical protein JWP72_236 [Massilia sp.]|nr:hypothetical protein [Massilia sp.]MDB5791932.1 hypothetical protein [Massilia sp.]